MSLPGFVIGMINDRLPCIWNLTGCDCDAEEGGDVFNRSRSEMLEVENAELVGAKCLTVSTALDCSHY